MKIPLNLLPIFTLLISALSTSTYASQHIKNSIFQVISNGSSTAFLTQEGLVTTLHSVLPGVGFRIHNFSQIQVKIGKLNCVETVKLIGAIPKMDLALLSVPKKCKAPPLKTNNYKPSKGKLMLYGHPLSISVILDSEVRVRNIGLKPASIYLPRTKRRGPYTNTKVISLDEHMLPGHSGAPLFSGNQVVAIANGGKHGTPVSWAIPWSNNTQWLKESNSTVKEINRLAQFPKGGELYQSTTSKDTEIITIEFSNGRLMSIPVQNDTTVKLGEQNGHPTLIRKGYSNQVIDYNLKVSQKVSGSNQRFANGSRRAFNFIRNGKNLLLQIKPPEVSIDANYIYDNVNKLMWTKQVVSKSWAQAKNYVHNINAHKTFEYSDWRLPSRGELVTLNKIAKNNPQLINNTSDWYWSLNESSFLGRAIIVNGGNVPGRNELSLTHATDKNMSVRLVRSFH